MSDLELDYLPAAAYGPPFRAPVHIEVIHSTEGPMSRGNARALAINWFGRPANQGGAGTSAHAIFDPSGGVMMVPLDHVAWHCGPGGNGFTRGDEHCGRVSLTKEEWLSADGRAMLDHSARHRAARLHAFGGLPRWLSITQLRNQEPGMCTHNDIRLAFGGTTHSDPGPNFPYGWYLQRVQFYYDGGSDAELGEIMGAAEDIVAAVDRVNANLTGTYRKDTAPNATQESGSLTGISRRLTELGDTAELTNAKLDQLITLLTPDETP